MSKQQTKMNQLLITIMTICVLCYWVNGDCRVSGAWECSGGSSSRPIDGITFGEDEDDDSFSLFVHTSDCTIMQDGDYTIRSSDISVDLNGFFDNCETSGASCTCFEDFHMTISTDCLDITGPNGEQCQPARQCEQYVCADGSTPATNPNFVPSTNECGPQSFPVGAPEFSFAQCCQDHDYCYPICGKDKRDCDYEFYECMACSCYAEYDNLMSREACLVLACVYFEAVDNFGCDAYESSQIAGCVCPETNAKSLQARSTKMIPDKFGGLHEYDALLSSFEKGTFAFSDFICEAPFEPSCAL